MSNITDKNDVSPALVVNGLTKKFGKMTAVDALTFTMPRGGVIGFVGPNGAGKSTTIRMILGLTRPTGGNAEILGHGICSPHEYLGKVGALVEVVGNSAMETESERHR